MSAPSFWLEDVDRSPRDPLDGSTSADVAIVGAGLTGLWTAYELLRRDPSLDVVVCEAEHVGFGASGRNGAWCSSGLGVSPGELARRTSPATARRTVEVMRATVAEVARVCDAEGIDAQVRRGGILRVARGRHEAPRLRAAHGQLDALGLADDVEVLTAVELAGRVRVAGAHGALFDPHGAVLHPGRLVAGLADRVEACGGRIHEGTPVEAVEPAPRPRLRTARGDVRAGTVVLATEAWLSRLPGWHRRVMPVYSLIVLTEPLTDEQWAAIGWAAHECLSSHRLTVDYLSRTADGRILFGGRGAPYHFGSRIAPRYDRHDATHALLREHLTSWFPALRGIGFSHAWGGPLGMPRDWLPSFTYDPATGVAAAYGYTGQGVSTANLAGRVLAEWITTGSTAFDDLPMVGHEPRAWEPEPLRWLAVRYLQTALARLDDRAERTGEPPSGRSLAERLVRH